jgi:L-ascorbate metabolism protein UlaG (beta-lactamase superfamily)
MSRRFQNVEPAHKFHTFDAVLRWGIGDRWTGRRRIATPGAPAPAVEPDPELLRRRDGLRLTWIGHASFFGVLGGARFLVDPVFSRRVGVFYPRHGRPGFPLAALPPVDLLLVTHAHYDHLDAPTVRRLPRTTPVVVPLGLGRWFRRRGFESVTELDRWESVEVGGVRVTLTPSRHWSRRGVADFNLKLWGGFVLEADGRAVYHAGDSGYCAAFAEIGRRFPAPDAALLPIGAYTPAWFMEPNHMNPEQAGRAFLDLGARCLVPMHWGTFQLTDEPLSEPAQRMRTWWASEGPDDGRRLCLMAVGETLSLP